MCEIACRINSPGMQSIQLSGDFARELLHHSCPWISTILLPTIFGSTPWTPTFVW